jgi:ectoine hydroxylase-related dioxygenase (phytanoyl-CoA dioxygenase family)
MSELSERGWMVVRGAVARGRLAELEAAVDAIYAATPEVAAGQVWEMAGVSRVSAVIASHTHDPAMARYAADALGAARVQLLQDTVLVKAARTGGEVAWHQDHTYTGYLEPARVVSVRLALTDDTAGCLEVIDGSHHFGLIGDVRALTETHVADALGVQAGKWAERVVRIELEAGDLSIHHCLTLHYSGPNASAWARKTLITRMFDSECRLLPERLPPGAASYFPADERGHLSEHAFPILAGRTPPSPPQSPDRL